MERMNDTFKIGKILLILLIIIQLLNHIKKYLYLTSIQMEKI